MLTIEIGPWEVGDKLDKHTYIQNYVDFNIDVVVELTKKRGAKCPVMSPFCANQL